MLSVNRFLYGELILNNLFIRSEFFFKSLQLPKGNLCYHKSSVTFFPVLLKTLSRERQREIPVDNLNALVIDLSLDSAVLV